MIRSSLRAGFALVAVTTVALPHSAQGGASGWTERVSFAADGSQVTEDARRPQLSADGRIVAYMTEAALIPADTNGVRDVYVYDRDTGKLVCASKSTWGKIGNDESDSPSLSADGRWLAFHSKADNLAGFDYNDRSDVFLKDLKLGTLRLVSGVNASAVSANGHSYQPSVSDDGRFVAFHTYGDNFVPGDTNGLLDVYVRDMQLNTVERVSIGIAGEPNEDCREPAISGDGSRVSYHSSASNLGWMDPFGYSDVFVHDRNTGVTLLVSRTPGGAPGNEDSYRSQISSDGQRVLFLSTATDLSPHDTHSLPDVYSADLTTGEVELVSYTYTGKSGTMPADGAGLSRDGRFAAFATMSSVFPQHTPGRNVFLRELETGRVWLASRPDGAVGPAGAASWSPNVNGDGSIVAFSSGSTKLDKQDTNGVKDIYLRTHIPDPEVYCDVSPSFHGCLPKLSSTGYPSARFDSGFVVGAKKIPAKRPVMLFYGFSGRGDLPFKGGTLCVLGALKRSVVVQTDEIGPGVCDGLLMFDINAFAAGKLGGKPSPLLRAPGQQVNAQFWGRDQHPGLYGAFLTNAIEFVVGP